MGLTIKTILNSIKHKNLITKLTMMSEFISKLIGIQNNLFSCKNDRYNNYKSIENYSISESNSKNKLR